MHDSHSIYPCQCQCTLWLVQSLLTRVVLKCHIPIWEEHVVITSSPVSFSSILWCCHTRNHPQGDLPRFGYRPAMKAEIYQNPFISWLLAWTMCLKRWQIYKETSPFLALFFSEGNIQQNFFLKKFPSKWGNLPQWKFVAHTLGILNFLVSRLVNLFIFLLNIPLWFLWFRILQFDILWFMMAFGFVIHHACQFPFLFWNGWNKKWNITMDTCIQ